MAPKIRLDELLVQKQLAKDLCEAQALIMAGKVGVEGCFTKKAGSPISLTANLTLKQAAPYVGRGGHKLAHALAAFRLSVQGCIAIDVGASTGGFTDVLLQNGIARVYAIDVGYGELHWRLRNDPQVEVLERTNVRHLERLPGGVLADCGVVDVSFISLCKVLPAMQALLLPKSWIVALVKPQFEAHPAQVEKGGIVRAPETHRKVLQNVLDFAARSGLTPGGLSPSPITGSAGNREFLVWLQQSAAPAAYDWHSEIDRVIEAS